MTEAATGVAGLLWAVCVWGGVVRAWRDGFAVSFFPSGLWVYVVDICFLHGMMCLLWGRYRWVHAMTYIHTYDLAGWVTLASV